MFGIDGIFIGGGRGTDGERVLLQKEGGEECCDKGEPGAWGDICWGKGIVKGMEVGLGWMWWEGAFSDFDGDLFVFFDVDVVDGVRHQCHPIKLQCGRRRTSVEGFVGNIGCVFDRD